MKARTLIIALSFLFIGSTVQAQFWKKLTKTAEKAAERAVIRKTEQKVSKETEKGMDTILGNGKRNKSPNSPKSGTSKNEDRSTPSQNTEEDAMGSIMGRLGGFGAQVDPAILPQSYSYNWRYTLRMKHEKGEMDMNYHLRKNGTDFATKIEMEQESPMGGMLMVMDGERGVMAMLMEMSGTKTGQLIEMDFDEIDATAAANEMNDYEYKEIGTKQLLGYTCQGYEMENEDLKMTMYIALNTPVSLSKVAQDPKRMPKGFDPKWLNKIGEDNLMMEMQVEHKKKKKHNATMTCVALEQEPMTITMSEYKFGF